MASTLLLGLATVGPPTTIYFGGITLVHRLQGLYIPSLLSLIPGFYYSTKTTTCIYTAIYSPSQITFTTDLRVPYALLGCVDTKWITLPITLLRPRQTVGRS